MDAYVRYERFEKGEFLNYAPETIELRTRYCLFCFQN